ncbi:MAG: endopeptidase La [Deltaproteobacteria bacterium]|nr:endopeptidase La [Deltaproteobacteria bacterium]
MTYKQKLPLLPIRDIVFFPQMVSPFFIGRPKSVQAIEEAMSHNKMLFLATQKDASNDNPGAKDIYKIGSTATVLQLIRLPDGSVKALIEGLERARILQFIDEGTYFQVEVEPIQCNDLIPQVELMALTKLVLTTFEDYIKIHKKIPQEIASSIASIQDPSRLVDVIAAQIPIKTPAKQKILEEPNPLKRLEKLYTIMRTEIKITQTEERIKDRVRKQMEKIQKDFYLNEQIRAIHKEIGSPDDKNDLAELAKQIKKKKLSKEASQKIEQEFNKLKAMAPMSAEATVVRNYIDWILAIPWCNATKDNYDLEKAERILNAGHYGLEKPKERILEHLAVQALTKKLKGPILCLAGPPGVGKTSLAKSVADAMGRNFIRISLGGVRDEAEIRGHRRTYIGAMPGKIIQSMKKANSINPVFCLDEIDKMSSDFRGDPSAALLEVLDPEQNKAFNDHYLDLNYDLSNVLFITTANSLHTIPLPLQDRMEIIELSGYTEEEKLEIANNFLIPKQVEAHGLAERSIQFTDDAVLEIIRSYTREAGVRNLERAIATVCRKMAKEIATDASANFTTKITPSLIIKYLGVPKYRFNSHGEKDQTGVVTGLAWTETGGSILYIEAAIMPGKGNLTITGKLGDVMQESARAALSYVRTRAHNFNLPLHFYEKIDIHIHVPEGAIPKDGPSAGITIATAIVSALLRIPARHNVAMTGEITLSGRVLPIGGLKEKILAAKRAGIDTILIPQENEKDLQEIPQKLLKNLTIKLMDHMDEVLTNALAIETAEQLFVSSKTIPEAFWLDGFMQPPSDVHPASH